MGYLMCIGLFVFFVFAIHLFNIYRNPSKVLVEDVITNDLEHHQADLEHNPVTLFVLLQFQPFDCYTNAHDRPLELQLQIVEIFVESFLESYCPAIYAEGIVALEMSSGHFAGEIQRVLRNYNSAFIYAKIHPSFLRNWINNLVFDNSRDAKLYVCFRYHPGMFLNAVWDDEVYVAIDNDTRHHYACYQLMENHVYHYTEALVEVMEWSKCLTDFSHSNRDRAIEFKFIGSIFPFQCGRWGTCTGICDTYIRLGDRFNFTLKSMSDGWRVSSIIGIENGGDWRVSRQ